MTRRKTLLEVATTLATVAGVSVFVIPAAAADSGEVEGIIIDIDSLAILIGMDQLLTANNPLDE
ncbi:MAG: hypothetical protein J2P50_10530 [Hyphomicrobiaceae bacterium]|nr:hypothetical protein [Hyphomicrobiaceae bacterium]